MPMAVPMAMVPAVAMAHPPNDARKRARKTYLQNAGRKKREPIPYDEWVAQWEARGEPEPEPKPEPEPEPEP